MWVFTRQGFFSAVCARQGSGKHGQPIDLNRIMVRAPLGGKRSASKRGPGTSSLHGPRLEQGCRRRSGAERSEGTIQDAMTQVMGSVHTTGESEDESRPNVVDGMVQLA